MRMPPFILLCLAVLIGWSLHGCSKEKLSELADQAKQAVSDQASKVSDSVKQQVDTVTDSAKEQLALAGSFELALAEPVTTSGCYGQLITLGDGRANVLRMASYREASQETFPSVMLQAQVPAASPSELVGQTVAAKMFVQVNQQGPIWFCAPGQDIQLKVTGVENQQIHAEVAGGTLRNSQTGADQPVSGKLTGVLP